jgi:hypothetical protein
VRSKNHKKAKHQQSAQHLVEAWIEKMVDEGTALSGQCKDQGGEYPVDKRHPQPQKEYAVRHPCCAEFLLWIEKSWPFQRRGILRRLDVSHCALFTFPKACQAG